MILTWLISLLLLWQIPSPALQVQDDNSSVILSEAVGGVEESPRPQATPLILNSEFLILIIIRRFL